MDGLMAFLTLVLLFPYVIPVGLVALTLVAAWRADRGARAAREDAKRMLLARGWALGSVLVLAVQAFVFAALVGAWLYLATLVLWSGAQNTVMVLALIRAARARRNFLALLETASPKRGVA